MGNKAIAVLVLSIAVTACTDGNDTGGRTSAAQSDPYVLRWDEGGIFADRQGRTTRIKVSPETGSNHLAMGTQELPPGATILVHRHDRTEEILYVAEGEGTLVLGDRHLEIGPDTTVWAPPGTWHGAKNVDSRMHVLWFVTPPGLDDFFRGMFWHPGEEPKQLTPEEILEIERLHDSVAQP